MSDVLNSAPLLGPRTADVMAKVGVRGEANYTRYDPILDSLLKLREGDIEIVLSFGSQPV